MGGTVDNDATWLKAVLIPFWVIEMLLEILALAFTALALTALMALQNEEFCSYDEFGDVSCETIDHSALGAALGAEGAGVALACIFLIMHIVQIVLYATHRLTPNTNFGIELSRFILWTIVFILGMVAIAQGSYTIVSIVFIVLLEASYIGSLAYASTIYHRYRTGSLASRDPEMEMYYRQQQQEQQAYTMNQQVA